MATLRAHIVLPAQLARDIDEIAGPRGRSAFLVETAAKEVRRRKLLAFLQSDEPVWRDENHPELV
jgi:alkylation response protein AidB-like acyl-CoA dehydrogenase